MTELTRIGAKVVADSINPQGARLTTLEVTLPRIVLAEFNTHRAFSRNSASSRAIPFTKMLRQVMEDPYIPAKFGTYNTGMQPAGYLEGAQHDAAVQAWLSARKEAALSALELALGDCLKAFSALDCALTGDWEQFDSTVKQAGGPIVAKETVNRLLEPFMWTTVLVTATDWQNFFDLRISPDAQHDIQSAAVAMRQAMMDSTPNQLDWNEWHIPYLNEDMEAYPTQDQVLLSASACARVSYQRQGVAMSFEQARKLAQAGHLSPFEHQARATPGQSHNLHGWRSQRADM